MGEWKSKNMINEMMQGRELAQQLRLHFQHAPPSSSSSSSASSNLTRELLIFRILLSFDKALSMLSRNYASGEPAMTGGYGGSRLLGTSNSLPSPGESPMSGDSDRDNKEHEGNNNNNNNNNGRNSRNNRKSMQRWTKRVKVTHGNGIEGQLDDGHSWRKYGQKEILGAKYPRGYYRCTHRDTQGCLATKQVQRSNEDPAVFEISYRGMHTCNHTSVGTDPSSSKPENEGPNDASVVVAPPQQQQQHQHQQADLEPQRDHDELLDFYKSLATITDGSSKNPLTAFSLPSISDDSHQSLHPFDAFNFLERVTGFDLFRENQNFQSPDNSELGLVVSAANGVATSSGTNSRAANARGSLDYLFDPTEFDNSFGNPGFFSE